MIFSLTKVLLNRRFFAAFLFVMSVNTFYSVAPAQAWEFFKSAQAPQNKATYIVESCNDGDTCRVRNSDNVTIKVRLAGIDAPETSHKNGNNKADAQPFALESKDRLNELVKGKTITLNTVGVDMYNRNIAEIFADGVNINLNMVENGLAEVYRGKMPEGVNTEKYRVAESEAKKLKKGIWSASEYESPKQFRKKTK